MGGDPLDKCPNEAVPVFTRTIHRLTRNVIVCLTSAVYNTELNRFLNIELRDLF